MISKMREMALPIMVVILVSFVIGTIFFNWGMNRGGSTGSNTTVAGKVNGYEIPLSNFDREVEMSRQNMERQGTDNDQVQYGQIVKQVWEEQVSRILLRNFFKKACLYASADEVFDYIKNNPPAGVDSNPNLMTNGVFDTAKYVAVLNDPRTYENNPSIRIFEQQTRELTIPSQKMELLLTAPLLPTRAEIEQIYRDENEKAVFEYAYIKNSAVKIEGSAVTDSMIERYYSVHRDSFRCDEMADLYVIKFPKIATVHDEQVYYQELLDIRDKLAAEKEVNRTEAFAEEAKISSDDERNAQNGGDLGFIRRGAMAPELDSALFRLDSGEISLPVKTSAGYHLVYVEKKRKPGKTEEIKVRHILRKIVPTIETLDAITEKIDSLRVKILDESFTAVAREATSRDPGIVFDSTGFFPRHGTVPGIGYVSGIGKFLFGVSRGGKDIETVSERLENSGGFYLFSVKRQIPKGYAPLESVKPRIRKVLLDSLREKALLTLADAWSRKAGEKMPLATLKKLDSAVLGSGVTDTISQSACYIPGVGLAAKAAAVACALPVGTRSGIIPCSSTYLMVRPLWKGPAATVPWGSQQVSMTAAKMMGELRQQIFWNWYRDYKDRQMIVSNLDMIYLD